MRIEHIDNFNTACKSVGKLAEEAIAEHRRQLAQLEAIYREAAALAGPTAANALDAEPLPDAGGKKRAPASHTSHPVAQAASAEFADAPSQARARDEGPIAPPRPVMQESARPSADDVRPGADVLKIAMRRAAASPFAPPYGRVLGATAAAVAVQMDEVPERDEMTVVKPAVMPSPRGGIADDLQRIRGIGGRNEKFLNALGIFHFDQIASWTLGEARWVAQHTAFPERTEHDDWVGQAAALARGGNYDEPTAKHFEASRKFDGNENDPKRESAGLGRAFLRVLGR